MRLNAPVIFKKHVQYPRKIGLHLGGNYFYTGMFIAHLTLIFSFLFVVTATLFFSKKQSRTGNRLLGLVMLILAFQHFMHYLWATQKVYEYTWLLNIDVPLDG